MQAEDGKACNGHVEGPASPSDDYPHDIGTIGLAISPPLLQKPNGALGTAKQSSRSRIRRREAGHGDSDSGTESDFEESGISPALETRMTVIEALARQGVASSTAEANGVFSRVADSLRDLTSQANIENHTTRYDFSF